MFKKLFTSLLVLSLIVPTSLISAIPANAQISSTQISRLAGENRYDTAIEIVKHGWNQSDTAVIANGEDFPDALCSAPLAQKYKAPILLTEKTGLSRESKLGLAQLGVKNVIIVGGKGVVSEDIVNELDSLGVKSVRRIGGNDRYETSVLVAEELGKPSEAVVATGDNFPDALSVASIAAIKQIPILLTPKDSYPSTLNDYLKEYNIKNTYVIGGTGVVGTVVENILPQPKRLSGLTRYETNIAVLQEFSNLLDPSMFYVATGENFPDALAGSALAPMNKAPILLIGSPVEESTKNYIKQLDTLKQVIALGGPGVVSDSDLMSIQFKFQNQGAGVVAKEVNVIDKLQAEQVERQIESVVPNEAGSLITVAKGTPLDSMRTGEIFYLEPTSNNPFGFAGKVQQVTEDSLGNTVLNVEEPALNEIFSELNYDIQKSLTQQDLIKAEFPFENDPSNLHITSVKSPVIMGSGTPEYAGDIHVPVPEITIDLDGNKETTNDQVQLKYDLTLMNTSVDAGIELNRIKYTDIPYSIKSLKARFQTTQVDQINVDGETSVTIGAEQIRKLFHQSGNKTDLGKYTLAGVDMSDKVVIGNLSFAIGSIPVQFKPGEPTAVPLGASVLITTTLNGVLSAEVHFERLSSTYFDQGFQMQNFNVTIYDEVKKSKPVSKITTGGTAKLDVGLGAGLGIIVMGICPAQASADIVMTAQLEGGGTADSEGNASASLSGSLTGKFIGTLAAGLKLEGPWVDVGNNMYSKTKEMDLFEPILFNMSTGGPLGLDELKVSDIPLGMKYGDLIQTLGKPQSEMNQLSPFDGYTGYESKSLTYSFGTVDLYRSLYDTPSSDDLWVCWITVKDSSLVGPRGIKVGDSAESVLKKFPNNNVLYPPSRYTEVVNARDDESVYLLYQESDKFAHLTKDKYGNALSITYHIGEGFGSSMFRLTIENGKVKEFVVGTQPL